MGRAAPLLMLLGLAACADMAQQEAAWREQETARLDAFCTSAGFTPGSDAHKTCQQIEALNQRLARVEQRLDRLEFNRIPPYGYGSGYWP